MKNTATQIAKLDQWYPPCGSCAFCGGPDKRHRLWDAWIAMAEAGETAAEVAKNYDANLRHVQAVLRIRPYQ